MKRLEYSLEEVVLSTRPARKFSGWTRHHLDHGSLGGSVFEPEPWTFTEKVEWNLFMILSVGKVTLLNTEISLSPDDDSKESKRKPKFIKSIS